MQVMLPRDIGPMANPYGFQIDLYLMSTEGGWVKGQLGVGAEIEEAGRPVYNQGTGLDYWHS